MHIYLQTSDSTGEINKAFEQISKIIREDIQKRVNIVAMIIPKLIFFTLVIYMTYSLLQSQAEHFKMLDSIWFWNLNCIFNKYA